MQQLFIVAVAFRWVSCRNILEKRIDTEQKCYSVYHDDTIDQNFIETVAKTCLWLCFAKRDVPFTEHLKVPFHPSTISDVIRTVRLFDVVLMY